MKRMLVFGAAALSAALTLAVLHAQPAAPPQGPGSPGVQGGRGRGGMAAMFGTAGAIQKVADNLYVIPGGGGNTSVYVTSQGVVLVDVKIAGQGQAILDQIRTVTNKPILYLINTHSHMDHTGNNAFFPETVEIVAHENVAAQLAMDPAFQSAAAKRGLVNKTFKDKLTLLSGDDAVDLYNFGPAHTSGDSLVVFRKARAMAAGDVFAGKGQPLIDTANGGSGINYGECVGRAVSTIENVDIVIPGHSANLKWQDFVDFGEFNRLVLAHARESLKAGKTSEQAMKDFHMPAKFTGYTLGPTMLQPSPAGNFETIYQQLQASR